MIFLKYSVAQQVSLNFAWKLTPSISIVCVLFSLVGCAVAGQDVDPGEQSLEIEVLHQSTNCGGVTESHWLTSQQQYESIFQTLFRGTISDTKQQLPRINFDDNALLLISMGQQRTGGYQVKLASSQLQLSDGRAKVSVSWIMPKSGMVTIQVLTNPCLLLEFPRNNYQFVDVVDQAGKVRQTIPIQ